MGAVLKHVADPMDENFYEDANDWNVPEEYEEMPEFEDAVARAINADRDVTLRDALNRVGKAIGRDLLSGHPDLKMPPRRLHLERGAPKSGRYSANYRFTEGSMHGPDDNLSYHGGNVYSVDHPLLGSRHHPIATPQPMFHQAMPMVQMGSPVNYNGANGHMPIFAR